MIAKDKILHFIAGLLITLSVGFITSIEYGVLAGVMAGVLKEIYDEIIYGGFDTYDILATFLGVLVACGALGSATWYEYMRA